MVTANLHMICGNCGCSTELHHTVTVEEGKPLVCVTCNNCHTIFDLSAKAPLKELSYTSLYTFSSSEFGVLNHCSDGYVRSRGGDIHPINS